MFGSPGALVGAAFLGAFFGTLVWVNCRGAWFVMHFARLPTFAPSLTLAYTMWLICYGLMGGAVFLCLKMGGRWGKCALIDAGILLVSYFFSLVWQPLFYSAHFVLLSLLALIPAAGATVLFLIRVIRKSALLALAGGVILAIQGFFLVFTACCF